MDDAGDWFRAADTFRTALEGGASRSGDRPDRADPASLRDIGLVRPSGRTASGHRLYEESDVERLYQVLALRQLGLSLDAIATVTDGDTSLSEILDAHRAYLDDQLAATRTLRAQVEMLSRTVRTSPDASVADFLHVIRGVIEVDDIFERYFDKGQIADLAERRAMLGDDVITAAETSWQELIRVSTLR